MKLRALTGLLAGTLLLGGGVVKAAVQPGATAALQAPATPLAGGPLQSQAEAIVASPDEWSILAWSLDRDEPLFAINPEEIRIPASNNKVFSSIWALDVLGPDYRFPTDLLTVGEVEEGVLRGPVVIRGSGDPAFGYPEYDEDPLESVRPMAEALRRRGVRTIEGGIVADATIHQGPNFGPDWPTDTGNGAAYYAPTVSGLPYQRNVLVVKRDREAPRGFATEPAALPEIPVVNEGGQGRGYAVRKVDEDTIRIRGAAGAAGQNRYRVGAAEPAYLAAGALRQALREAGITVTGPIRLAATPEGAELVHRHYSIPLGEIVPQLNKHSDNFFAEHLWKAAVAKSVGVGSYARGGMASARFFHARAGVPWGHLWQADGSGLSAQNQSSALALVQALRYADQRPWSEVFHESLAVGGEREGTLRRLFTRGPAAGNLHAKTGYINDVRTLSGYVTTRDGERVAFSFLYNGRGTSAARGVQTQLGELIAEYAR